MKVLYFYLGVATREGGVDRNIRQPNVAVVRVKSPPARVAWIETRLKAVLVFVLFVATREGGVDRNVRGTC